jgi:hypothetical protein
MSSNITWLVHGGGLGGRKAERFLGRDDSFLFSGGCGDSGSGGGSGSCADGGSLSASGKPSD